MRQAHASSANGHATGARSPARVLSHVGKEICDENYALARRASRHPKPVSGGSRRATLSADEHDRRQEKRVVSATRPTQSQSVRLQDSLEVSEERLALDDVRGRLAGLYGPRAALAVDRTADDRVQVILEVPHERSDRSDR